MHRGEVKKARFSLDGKRVVTASDDGTAQIWDAKTGQKIGPALRREAPVRSACFSPDGKRVATGGEDGLVRLWEAKSGRLLRALKHPIAIRDVAFSPNGKVLAVACFAQNKQAGATSIWHLDTNKHFIQVQKNGPVWNVAFRPDGRQVVFSSDFYGAQVRDVVTGREVR
jgi:WD40 repeat protein